VFLLGSRYRETDLLSEVAWASSTRLRSVGGASRPSASSFTSTSLSATSMPEPRRRPGRPSTNAPACVATSRISRSRDKRPVRAKDSRTHRRRHQPRPRSWGRRGAFRQDLYYRLKVVELHVPALRERRDDVLPLSRVLLADAALRMRKFSGLAPGVADQLLRYGWPGNVRELESVMERAVALARGSRVELEHLARGDPTGAPGAYARSRHRPASP